MNILAESLLAVFNSAVLIIGSALPKIIGGLLILFIGLVVASLLRDLILVTFQYFSISKWLEAAGLAKKSEVKVWPKLLSELIRWITIFIFLMPAVEMWGVPRVSDVLRELLLFLPNVFIAVIIAFAGLVASRLISDIVRHSVRELGDREALVLSNIAKYAIIFFTSLIILTQLGVAAELVKILFTGIVGMLALAFGLAFGLGGQDEARSILKKLRKKLEKK